MTTARKFLLTAAGLLACGLTTAAHGAVKPSPAPVAAPASVPGADAQPVLVFNPLGVAAAPAAALSSPPAPAAAPSPPPPPAPAAAAPPTPPPPAPGVAAPPPPPPPAVAPPAPAAAAPPPPLPGVSVAPPVAQEDAAHAADLAALKARRAALDERAAKVAAGRGPASPELFKTLQETNAAKPDLEQSLRMQDWRAQVAEHYLGRLQAAGGASFSAPRAALVIAPEPLLMVRENNAYSMPDSESAVVATFAKQAPVMKLAEIAGLDWIVVWADAAGAFAYLPSGAARRDLASE